MENFHERITANYAEHSVATSTMKSRTSASAQRFTLTPHASLTVARNIAVLEGNLLYINLCFTAAGATFINGDILFSFDGYKLAAQADMWAISETNKMPAIKIYGQTNGTGLLINSVGMLTGFNGYYDLCGVIPVIPA